MEKKESGENGIVKGQRTVCERIEYESLTQCDSAFVLRNIWLAKAQLIPDYESG